MIIGPKWLIDVSKITKIITIMTWNLSQDFVRQKTAKVLRFDPEEHGWPAGIFHYGTYEFDNAKWRSDKRIINKDATFSVLVHDWFSLLSLMFSCGFSGVFLGYFVRFLGVSPVLGYFSSLFFKHKSVDLKRCFCLLRLRYWKWSRRQIKNWEGQRSASCIDEVKNLAWSSASTLPILVQ